MWIDVIDNPYLNLIGCGLGAIGVLLAVIFYRKSRRIKRLTYAVRSFNLITDSVSGLSDFAATYKGKHLANLTATKLLIWNSGTEMVSRNDIAGSDPIQMHLPKEVFALDAQVTAISTPTNLVSVQIDPKQPNIITLNFDYFGAREGCLISFLHTGSRNEGLTIQGTIKGHGQPVSDAKRYKRIQPFFPILSTFFWSILASLIFIFAVVAPVFAVLEGRLTRKTGGQLDRRFEDAFAPSDFTQQ
jgi:hypothetical protein